MLKNNIVKAEIAVSSLLLRREVVIFLASCRSSIICETVFSTTFTKAIEYVELLLNTFLKCTSRLLQHAHNVCRPI